MRLSRLRLITMSEIACRARQETCKWLDRIAPTLSPAELRRSWPPDDLAAARTGSAARGVVQLMEAATRRFFPGPSDGPTAQVLSSEFAEPVQALLDRAERLLAGEFDLLGYRGLSFGHPIDWHFDPVANRRSPQEHWTRIDPLDPAMVGDSKVVWELNRHQWLVTLAQAWRLTQRPIYAERALTSIEEWAEANPYGHGINWASSLEVALRLMSWCWVLMLLRDAPGLTRPRLLRIQRLARTHALHVERYLSYYFSPNTHLTGEALGLFYAGVVLAHCPEAARWRDTGRGILIEQAERQIRPDGGYFEQATCYHRYTIEIYLHLLILAARNRISLPHELGSTVLRMLDWLVSVCRGDGSMPSIGDADGGWLMPLTPREPLDCRGVLALGAAVFDRADYAWAAGGPAPELVWVFGPAGLARFTALDRRPPLAMPSRVFTQSGYAVMRSGWDREAHQLIVDAGPLGCPISGAHGHSDLLSIQCAAYGEPYLIDPGTYCYTPDPAWRNYFRRTAAHNTIVVDRQNQADPSGPFSWRWRPAARLEAWTSAADHDVIDAVHDAYARLSQPVWHRRRVVFMKPHGWIVIDDLLGDGEHHIELRFHFAPRPVSLAPGGWVRAAGTRGRGLWLSALSAQPLRAEIREGWQNPIDGWMSVGYGERQPIPTLVYAGRVTTPMRLITVLAPAAPLLDAPPAIDTVFDAAGDVRSIRFPEDDRQLRLAGEALRVETAAGNLRIA